jgi:hypothetical protein
MTQRTRLYVGLTIALGIALVTGCVASEGAASHSGEYLLYCLLACVSSVMKVRLPGITGTISANFLFILISVALFSFAETVVLAAVACLIQCLWRSKSRPRLVQISFNIAALTISSGAAYRLAHLVAGPAMANLSVLLSVAVTFYFTADTLMISGVLSLVQKKGLFTVWQQCYLWSFPYYLAGAAVAGLVLSAKRSAGLAASLAVLPLMCLAFVFYRMCVERAEKRVMVTAS